MEIVIKIPDEMYDWLDNGFPDEDDAERLWQVVKNGTPLPKCHGDLIDRKELEVVPIDITDLPIDRCLMVYLAEDVEGAKAIIEAEKAESEE